LSSKKPMCVNDHYGFTIADPALHNTVPLSFSVL
jgi:hypothetical protein